MRKERLEAYTDAVLAILITMMVLGIKAPVHDFQWSAILKILPTLGIYSFSFFVLGTYWVNHFNLFRCVKKINSHILWYNNLSLFSFSFIPFSTSWLIEGLYYRAPETLYGLVLLISNIAYLLLILCLRKSNADAKELENQKIICTQSIILNIIALIMGQLIPIATLVINFINILLLWVYRAVINRQKIFKNNKKK